ncbi:rhomboid family intramembrane serine protease [Candidatus Microgenomates bacterium]|nr:rhomboid family intramembrane serine protease [Candidatus Microgenomates bacterium]
MIPLRDSQPAHTFPFWVLVIIALNTWVFFLEFSAANPELFISQWALIPTLVDWGNPVTFAPFITSQFLHAGLVHILSNMWFLWIFGDNVEGYFGKLFFPIVYLFSGFVGGAAQYLLAPNSTIPMLGASGAIAGVLGAYLVLFPRHTIKTLVPVFGFITVTDIPASVMLFYWFFTQLFAGVGSLAIAAIGGVAWFAHIGGFITGWIFATLGKSVHE